MGSPKPFIHAACICENVLIDKDNVASLIRVVDTFTLEVPDSHPPGVPIGFPVTLFISVKSGGMTGEGKLAVQPKRPDGTLGGRQEFPAVLSGAGTGAQYKLGFTVLNPQEGLYWFDVLWDGDLLTSVPAHVKLLKQQPFPESAKNLVR